jgi:membrane-bound inhibitor of C-type lysozyme
MTHHNITTLADGSAPAWPFLLRAEWLFTTRTFRALLLGFGLPSIIAATMVSIAPAAAQNSALQTFRCDDGTSFVVAFYRGESLAHVQLDGKAMALPRRLSLSRARYSVGGITLRIKESAATLSRGRETTECSSS